MFWDKVTQTYGSTIAKPARAQCHTQLNLSSTTMKYQPKEFVSY